MWLSAIKLAMNAGSHVYKKRQQTKMLMADAQMRHAEKMSSGELEYKAKIIESNDNGWKDEFVLVLVSLPMLLLGWSVFSDDPEIRNKLDLFFEYFKNLPYWYQAIFIGVVIAVAMGVFAYTEVTARLTSLETSRELFENDLLKKSEQVPTDQEQHFLLEDLYKTVEKLQSTQEMNMTNKVNIEFLKSQLEKALADIEHLKDKVRANGKSY